MPTYALRKFHTFFLLEIRYCRFRQNYFEKWQVAAVHTHVMPGHAVRTHSMHSHSMHAHSMHAHAMHVKAVLEHKN